ncbi:MAG: sigma-E factor negative regulatory protein [Xanthomonadaceae bacterium]|nr:sigma-E factor negative regulatory protein [Xanthomonadaceae bacterium]
MKTETDRHCIDLTQLSSREQLSALLDGALPEDQTRFLLRRLQHDGELASSWERWRLAADVMRGSVPSQRLPADFAQRVTASLQGRALPPANAPLPAPRHRWLQWGGGAALVASLAVAALVSRPQLQQDSTSPATSAIPATASVEPAPAAPRPAPVVPQAPAPAMQAPGLLVAAAAVTSRPVRRGGIRPSPVVAPAAAAPVLELAQSLPDALPAMELTGRPWPRKILPQYDAGNGLAVGFATQLPAAPLATHGFAAPPGWLPTEPVEKKTHAADAGPARP